MSTTGAGTTSTPATTTPAAATAGARTDHNIWVGIGYDDPRAARAWLRALGFEEGIVADGENEGEIVHSEMVWPEGGRVMVHSRNKSDQTFESKRSAAIVYVVCDDPDEVHRRATQLGATFDRPMEETDYGSRGFSIRDVEGNSWSFGTYAG